MLNIKNKFSLNLLSVEDFARICTTNDVPCLCNNVNDSLAHPKGSYVDPTTMNESN